MAVEAEALMDEIRAAVEVERRAKQAESLAATHKAGGFGVSNNKLLETDDPNKNSVATKAAELFSTNRTYINEAAKLKASAANQRAEGSVNKLTEAKDDNATRSDTKAAAQSIETRQLIASSEKDERKTGDSAVRSCQSIN